MVERLRDSDVDRLRQIVGMGAAPGQKHHAKPQEAEPEIPEMPKRGAVFSENRCPDTRLFVKIDEHEAISKELFKSRKDIKSIADTIELLGKAEKLKAEAVARMEENLNKLDEKIKEIEPKLEAPEGLVDGQEPAEFSAYSDTLSDLKGELERLKDELRQ